MATEKKQQWVSKLEAHLRQTSRRLVRFDTLEETLSYLLESLGQELTCDFIVIILKEKGTLVPKRWMGAKPGIKEQLTMSVDIASPDLLTRPRWWQREFLKLEEECPFIVALLEQDLSTWFTVPLYDEQRSLGFCVIGFRQFVPIIMELEQNFIEFGKDVAVALNLAIKKEREKAKIKGIEWLRESTFDGSSLSQLIEKIAGQAGRGTQARAPAIYLFDEEANQFVFQPPAYGQPDLPEIIPVEGNNSISSYFPLIERTGGNETVVPLVVNLKTIGVLTVQKQVGEVITEDDLELLRFLATHVSALIENARLYTLQLEEQNRLRTFLDHHRRLVKQTVEGEGFETITATVHEILNKPVLLVDQFLRQIAYAGLDQEQANQIQAQIRQYEQEINQIKNRELWIPQPHSVDEQPRVYSGVWPVRGGGELLGYLIIRSPEQRLKADLRVILDYALNICAIQFIKHKIVMDTYDQLKDNFITHFLDTAHVDEQTLLHYSRLLNWNVTEPHEVAVVDLELGQEEEATNMLNLEAEKTFLWDKIKAYLSIDYKELIFTRKNHHLVIMSPVQEPYPERYWHRLYRRLTQTVQQEKPEAKVFLGIGDPTASLEDYPKSFKQAVQAVQVVRKRFRTIGYAFFNQLGSYTVLYQNDSPTTKLFIDRYLAPLIKQEGSKGVNLIHTLKVYLENNGNIKKTAEQLFIHRSTLQYRLDRIASILEVDLSDAEEIFNLMLALKLYELHYN